MWRVCGAIDTNPYVSKFVPSPLGSDSFNTIIDRVFQHELIVSTTNLNEPTVVTDHGISHVGVKGAY
jgi:hypothetical protein